ncbi:MAG: cytochrome P450 [Deltaproteobacteria bacterium]|nr:cytochrome P450 [Deltaproteobacteria bacterium]MBW2361290.1 cytochrome P450 [Deltaproteobacteria bacterium]
MTPALHKRATLPGDIDLTSPGCFRDAKAHHAAFARLRQEAPVAWHPHAGGGFWVVSRHADVLHVLRDTETFDQAAGHLIGGLANATPAAGAEAFAFRNGAPPFSRKGEGGHARLEAAAVEALVPGIRARIVERLAAHAGSGALDFVELIAPLPSEVRATLAGVPGAHQDHLIAWVDTLGDRRTGVISATADARREAAAELIRYAEKLLARKREQPGEDLISDWLAAETQASPVTARHVGVLLFAFIAVGSATTRNVAAAGQRLLFESPNITKQLRAAPDLLPAAIEEMLRLAPPFHYARRTAQRDAAVGGQRIAKGDAITLWLGSANRDSAVFEHPSRFAPERTAHTHLSFAADGLFTLGAALARIELVTLFDELLQRFPEMIPAGPTEHTDSNHENRIVRLPVYLGAAA